MSAELWMKVLGVLIEVLIVVGGGALLRLLTARLGREKLWAAVEVARLAVEFVEQVSERLGYQGSAKLRDALEQAKSLARAHGVALTDEQWKVLLEQAVRHMNQVAASYGRQTVPGG